MANEMRDRLVELLRGKSIDTPIDVEYVADHLIENGVVVPQWISVKDRLPEYGEIVWATDGVESHEAIMTKDNKWRVPMFFWLSGVTHWMPLPEPPKAEQKLKEMRGADNG